MLALSSGRAYPPEDHLLMLRINSPCAIDRFHIRGCSTIFQAVSGKIVAVEGAEPQNGKLRQINCPNTNNLYAAILELVT